MKTIFFFSLMLFQYVGLSQNKPITWVDVVKVKNGHVAEVRYFFENNWKRYRERAKADKQITDFKLMQSTGSDSAVTTFLLLTTWPDRAGYLSRENYFRRIMKEIQPKGPMMMNELKRDEILVITDGFLLEEL